MVICDHMLTIDEHEPRTSVWHSVDERGICECREKTQHFWYVDVLMTKLYADVKERSICRKLLYCCSQLLLSLSMLYSGSQSWSSWCDNGGQCEDICEDEGPVWLAGWCRWCCGCAFCQCQDSHSCCCTGTCWLGPGTTSGSGATITCWQVSCLSYLWGWLRWR